MAEVILCGSCKKELTNTTEIEHSFLLGEYFCNPDCADNRYFDYAMSSPVDLTVEDQSFKIIKGKLVRR